MTVLEKCVVLVGLVGLVGIVGSVARPDAGGGGGRLAVPKQQRTGLSEAIDKLDNENKLLREILASADADQDERQQVAESVHDSQRLQATAAAAVAAVAAEYARSHRRQKAQGAAQSFLVQPVAAKQPAPAGAGGGFNAKAGPQNQRQQAVVDTFKWVRWCKLLPVVMW
jgi:hypothetical protein